MTYFFPSDFITSHYLQSMQVLYVSWQRRRVYFSKKSSKTYFMLAEDEVRLRRESFLLLVISCSKLIWRWRYLVMVSSRISEILSKVWWHLTFSFSNAISLCKQKCIVESRMHTIWELLGRFQKNDNFSVVIMQEKSKLDNNFQYLFFTTMSYLHTYVVKKFSN